MAFSSYNQVPHLTQNITSVRERISLALGQSFFYHRALKFDHNAAASTLVRHDAKMLTW